MVIGLVLTYFMAGTGWASSTALQEEVQITGTVLKGGRLVDDLGQEYQMAKEDEVLEMEGQVGQKIEVKGTLMETGAGQKVINIDDYKVIDQ
jgi:RNase P/RNase MRP subunit p29